MLKYFVLSIVVLAGMALGNVNAAVWVAPSYEDGFSQYLTNEYADTEWRVETVYNLWVDSNKSLKDNIRCLFYPNSFRANWCDTKWSWWKLWDMIRYAWLWILILYIILAGLKLLIEWDKFDQVKIWMQSLVFIVYWSILFFGSTWILGSVLWLETVQWTQWLVEWLQWWPDSLFFKILSGLKALAFFIAIMMIGFYGFKIMYESDQAEKARVWIRWVINVVAALAIIKLIDYIYYIAQLGNFVDKATDFIVDISKIVWFIFGALIVIMVFYSGFLFITDQWKSENMKKAKNILIWILLSAMVIFMLLLIMYQIFAELA